MIATHFVMVLKEAPVIPSQNELSGALEQTFIFRTQLIMILDHMQMTISGPGSLNKKYFLKQGLS